MQEARREALEKARVPDRSREEAEERPPASSADNPTVTVNAIPGDEGGDAAPPDSGLESESNESEGSDNGILPEDEGDDTDPRTRVLSVLELEALFEHASPSLDRESLIFSSDCSDILGLLQCSLILQDVHRLR